MDIRSKKKVEGLLKKANVLLEKVFVDLQDANQNGKQLDSVNTNLPVHRTNELAKKISKLYYQE